MSYREDVALIISKDGWKDIKSIFDPMFSPAFFFQNDLNLIEDLLKEADHHETDDEDNHLFIFESIKRGAMDGTLLFDILLGKHVPRDRWYWFSLGEDGLEDSAGSMVDMPFSIQIVRKLDVQHEPIKNIPAHKLGLIPGLGPSPRSPAKVVTPVDNYTCGCGNSKLNSTTDKSCWKCGAAI